MSDEEDELEDEEDEDEEENDDEEDEEDGEEEEEEESNEEDEADEDDDTDANSKLSKKSSSKADKLKQLAKTFCLGIFNRSPVAPSDDATEDASAEDDGHSSERDSLEPADRRIFLTVVASEHVKVRDYLAGSNPYLIVKPDGRGGRRPTQRSKTEWLAPNTQFNESFELDITESDLPVRLVIWDHLEELTSTRDLKRAAKELAAANRAEVPPSEAYMRYVDVPDYDHPSGPELDPKRKRALPRFVDIPESRNPTTAWFPVQEPPLTMAGDDAFHGANKRATGGFAPTAGLIIRLCYQRIDPLTGEMLDAVEESIDETEVDRRSLLALLHATSKPPGLVWNPVSNWQYPDVSEDVTKWDGVKCDLRKRYLTHDEKTGDLLEPLEVPRVVSLDLSKRSIKGSMPANWFAENFSAMGASLSALHTIDMSDNKLEGMGLPRFATLETLTVLDLSENSLRGDLTALALPPSLVVLNLDYNYFKGPVEASWFTNLSNLTSLRLTGNRLNCEVPRKCWHFLASLQTLHMAKCGFVGACPLSIADAKELQTLNFSDNPDLDGELPTSLPELYWLEDVNFSGCLRLTDSRKVMSTLRDKGVAVQVWGTGISDPS